MKTTSVYAIRIISLLSVLIIPFQNCSPVKFSEGLSLDSASQIPADPILANPLVCSFNGAQVVDGASVRAYSNSSVPVGSTCEGEDRVCKDGVLSGSFQYAQCQPGVARACLFNGQTIASGDSIKAFQNSSVAFGAQCVSEDRLCTDGQLSGSYTFAGCAPGAAKSCLFNGQTIAHNGSVSAFKDSSVAYGGTCASEVRTCNDGNLSGSNNYASCAADQPKSCLFNGQTLAHGQKVIAYVTSSVAYGTTCGTEERTCNNGTLSGSYIYANCSVGAANSCIFNGQTMAHGQAVTAYSTSSVPYGQTCQSENRTCNNGTLTGSFNNNSCTVTPGASCTLDGVTVAHGATRNFFGSSLVTCGNTCTSTPRTCTNGVLSGSSSYASAACSVGTCQPQVCTNGGTNYPACNQCLAGYYYNGSQCVPQVCTPNSTRSCQDFPNAGIHPGTGAQTCNAQGSAWGACSRLTCSAVSGIQEGNCVGSAPAANVGTNLGDISSRFTNGAKVWDVKCDQDGWKWQYLCPAQQNNCQAVRQTMYSVDGSNTCTFATSGAYPGQSVTTSNERGTGGTATATCSVNGWSWSASCPSTQPSVVTCPAGEFSVPGHSKTYFFSYGQGTVNEVRTIYATNDSRGYGSVRCTSNGTWTILSSTLP